MLLAPYRQCYCQRQSEDHSEQKEQQFHFTQCSTIFIIYHKYQSWELRAYLLITAVIVVVLFRFLLSCLLIGRVLRFSVTCAENQRQGEH